MNQATLELAAIHLLLGCPRIIVMDEFDESEWPRLPAADVA